MSTINDTSFQYANFSTENWERLVHALRFYIEHEQVKLAKDNYGDREWEELRRYEGLIHDIEFYVIGRMT